MSFDDFLRWYSISLRTESLPTSIRGFAYYNGREYLIIINSRYSDSQQSKSLVHEMIHIFEDHFSCPKKYETMCEREVRNMINIMRTDEIKQDV